ncbi:penicillin-binding protein activator [Silvimonas sp.]|uniref:penicillin-binding protein activator n=1 Tax=Silvimonas sp. TaxID=2650811 RepID=UPI002848C123|nr:penicillin-binding protein activator [Silvimonas sp.]MDR3427183.1 penicillin-binding protein activator [Silvimonas sp.]
MHARVLPAVMRGVAAVLYGVALLSTSAAHAEPVVRTQIASSPAQLAASATADASQPADETASAPAATHKGGNFIAVILPAKAKAWKPAVEAIKSGLFAAESALSDGDQPPLRIFDTTDADDDILAQFNRAISLGAAAVIGPLTKSAVNNIGDNGHFDIPVLALNSFDSNTLHRPGFYSFSLSVESEAAQVAQQMRDDSFTHPVIVTVDGALAQRMTQGFTDGWRSANQTIVPILKTTGKDYAQLKAQLDIDGADAVFLAMDARQARKIRPFIGTTRAIYATSQINIGKQPATALLDLAGIHFLDMPWITQPNTPEYKIYEHARSPSNDLERLFAMGVDAWKITAALLDTPPDQLGITDGLTGSLHVDATGTIQRSLVPQVLTVQIPNAEAPGYTEAPASVPSTEQ